MKDEQTEKPTEAEETKHAAVPPHQSATEILANERTFLAWVRTSIAVMSLGFVIAKFGLWLDELAQTSPQLARTRTGLSVPVGIGMMIFGGLLVVLAAWRYHVVNRQIERGEVKADRALVILVTVLILVLSVVMAAYLLIAETKL